MTHLKIFLDHRSGQGPGFLQPDAGFAGDSSVSLG